MSTNIGPQTSDVRWRAPVDVVDAGCRSGEDDRLAEHGVAADERGPDVGPHAGHGRVA